MKDTIRKAALACEYELYDDPRNIEAAREIDAAVEAAANDVFIRMAEGLMLINAVHLSLKSIVSPIMYRWKELGSGDTEPEEHVVHVMMEHLENRLGFEPKLDEWDMRFCI